MKIFFVNRTKLLIKYSLYLHVLIMVLFDMYSEKDFPIWMILLLVFLVGLNIGTLIQSQKSRHDKTRMN